MLIHALISVGQHEHALEVFCEYLAHGIAPFQQRFQQAIRMACRYAQYDTAIDMVRAWIEAEHEQQQRCRPASTEERGFHRQHQEHETRSHDDTLWYMLEGALSRDQVEQVLVLMRSRRLETGPHVLRRVVVHHFTTATDDDELDADAVVAKFFEPWERVPETILRDQFVLWHVLKECESRGWQDAYQRVLEYAKENDIELPYGNATKIMEQHALLGELDDTIEVGERVFLSRLDEAAVNSGAETKRQTVLGDAFFVFVAVLRGPRAI
jgi:pentatricopeptide repeat protein